MKRTSTEAHVYMRRHQKAKVKHFDISNVIYHKFSHGAVSYRLYGKNVNVMLESPIDTNKTFSLENFKALSIDSKLETMFACLLDVKATNERLLKAERTVKQLNKSTQKNSRRIDLLAYKSIDIEARQRRNNLLFWGIPEVRNEDCIYTVISEFLGDKLGLDVDAITIQRAHRIGKLQHRQNVIGRAVRIRHRPLIVAFMDYQDVELVLSHANRLQGTPFGVNRDYPQEIIAARKPLFKEKKSLKAQQPNFSISIQYPAKLIVDGRVVKDMFPNWFKIMKCDRLNSKLGSNRTEPLNTQTGQSEQVFDSDPDYSDTNSENEQIEMATESNDTQSRGSFSQQDSQTSNGVRFPGSTPQGRIEPMDSSERNVGSAISTEVSSNADSRLMHRKSRSAHIRTIALITVH